MSWTEQRTPIHIKRIEDTIKPQDAIPGDRFWDRELVEDLGTQPVGKQNQKHRRWRVRCLQCGEVDDAHASSIVRGKAKCCIRCRTAGDRAWSPEEDAIVRDFYPSLGPNEIRRLHLPHRSIPALTSRAAILDVQYVPQTQRYREGDKVGPKGLVLVRNLGMRSHGNGRNVQWWAVRCPCGTVFEARASVVLRGDKGGRQCQECARRKMGEAGKLALGEASAHRAYLAHVHGAKHRGRLPLTEAEWRWYAQQPCWYCGGPPANVKHSPNDTGDFVYQGIDRIDSSKGYPGNSVPCCIICNHAKMDMPMETWLDYLKRLLPRSRYQKLHKWYYREVLERKSNVA